MSTEKTGSRTGGSNVIQRIGLMMILYVQGQDTCINTTHIWRKEVQLYMLAYF